MNKLSIILTTYNCAEHLTQTLERIDRQDYPEIEVCIKDGGSTDGTVDCIRSYASSGRFPLSWCTEPDSGIYDAMNRGYALSSGDVIVFFNDLFLGNDAVTKMMRLVSETGVVGAHADLVYATDKKVVRYWKMGAQRPLYTGWMPGHPTLFLKREIYEKYGLYDTTLRISADYEFMIRFLKDQENRLAYLPETIVRMYYGGTSNATAGSYLESLREGHYALKKNGIRLALLSDVLRTMRVLRQFLVPKRVREADVWEDRSR